MLALLDVNALIARSDPAHQFHGKIRNWFSAEGHVELATSAITENGFLRIYGHPNYPGGSGSPAAAAAYLAVMRALPGHRFLAEDFSILSKDIDIQSATSAQLTDLYLLALAVKHGAKFVTLDTQIDPAKVRGGPQALIMVPV